MKDIYIYKDEFDNECTFLRGKFYKYVCDLITVFFEEPLPDNEFHKNFVNALNNLEDYHDVYKFTIEYPWYWAICIIENNWTVNSLIKGKNDEELMEWVKKYKKENDIVSLIIDGINEETYIFTNKEEVKSLFLRKKYYEFISALVKDFFKQQIKFNDTEYSLITRLNALPSSGVYTDIIRRLNIPVIEEISDAENINIEHALEENAYQWAMSIIENKEITTVLDDKKLEEYNVFLDKFFKTNNIKSFIVSES
ncbi:hypothetical protein [Chryseobacterium sp. 22458]|uniref:hypothetical protein n=1 Tax=Chryseobacterium sp. 22458 TaxID=3453921 RepID=UPI003F848D83